MTLPPRPDSGQIVRGYYLPSPKECSAEHIQLFGKRPFQARVGDESPPT